MSVSDFLIESFRFSFPGEWQVCKFEHVSWIIGLGYKSRLIVVKLGSVTECKVLDERFAV